MNSKIEKELNWFQTAILPKIVTSGKLNSESNNNCNNNNNNYCNNNDFKVLNIDLKFIGADEAFMLTICYRATLHCVIDGVERTWVFVVKKTPALPQQVYDAINFDALFSNEIHTYNFIIKTIESYTKQNFIAPKYFYSNLQPDFGIIVLEDFYTHGWKLCDKKCNLSLEHILLAVQYLANFHGIGFAMKATNREDFNSLSSSLKESRYVSEAQHEDFAQQIKWSKVRLVNSVRKFQSQIPEEFLKKLLQLLANNYSYGKARVQPQEPLSTICHGDYLRNNLAFKYATDEELGKDTPIEVMMFDFQTMRLSSPMIDLTLLLALSAFAETRYKHFEEIFNVYCTTMAATYEKYAQKPVAEFLSYDSLLKEYTCVLPYSINIASYFLLHLVEPLNITGEEMLQSQRTPEEIEHDVLTRGGDVVSRELAHQVFELYELSHRHNVDFCQGLDISNK